MNCKWERDVPPKKTGCYYQKKREGTRDSPEQLMSTGALFLPVTDKEARLSEVRWLLPAAPGLVGRGAVLPLVRSLDGEKDHVGASPPACLEPSRHQNIPRGREEGLEGCWTPSCFSSAFLVLPRAGKDVQVC